MTRRWIIGALILLFAPLVLWAQNDWEGTATAGGYSDFPPGGLYAASNSFPLNSMVEITNPSTGAQSRVIITSTVSDPGVFILLSSEAAESIGLNTGQTITVRARPVSLPGLTAVDPNQDLPFHPDPDINPSASLGDPNVMIIDPLNRFGLDESETAEEPAAIPDQVNEADRGEQVAEVAEAVVVAEPGVEEPVVDEPAPESEPVIEPETTIELESAEVVPEEPITPIEPVETEESVEIVETTTPPPPEEESLVAEEQAIVQPTEELPEVTEEPLEVTPDLLPYIRTPHQERPEVTLALPMEVVEEEDAITAPVEEEPVPVLPDPLAPPHLAQVPPDSFPLAEADPGTLTAEISSVVPEVSSSDGSSMPLPLVEEAGQPDSDSFPLVRTPEADLPWVALPLVPVEEELVQESPLVAPDTPHVALGVTLAEPSDTGAPDTGIEVQEEPSPADAALAHEPSVEEPVEIAEVSGEEPGETAEPSPVAEESLEEPVEEVVEESVEESGLKPSLIPEDAVISLEPAEYRTPEVPEPSTDDIQPLELPEELGAPEAELAEASPLEPTEEPPEKPIEEAGEITAVEPAEAEEEPVTEVTEVIPEESEAVAVVEPEEEPIEEPVVAVAIESVDEIYAELPVVSALDNNSYYLQVAALTSIHSVKATVDHLGSTFPVTVVPQEDEGNSLFRVFVGPLTEDERGTALYAVRSKGYRDAFIR